MKKFALILTLFLACASVNLYSCKSEDTKLKYEISCELEGDKLVGVEKLTYVNDGDNVENFLVFNLHANAFREGAKYSAIKKSQEHSAYYNGVSYGNVQIKGVTTDNKTKLEYEIGGEDENVLIVNLQSEIYPGEQCVVIIEYDLTLPEVIARTGITKRTINLASFYPILCAKQKGEFYQCVYYSTGDPFFSEVADYVVTITLDKAFTVASSGELLSTKTKGEKSINRYEVKNARNFCFVLSKDYSVASEEVNGTTINYYFYDDENAKSSLQTAVKAMKLFNEKFCEYPYKTYSVCQTEFLEGGMEFCALSMISDNLEYEAYSEVIVHETAHQWWQGVVGNNEIEYGFLDESLAEYSVVIFYENHAEYGFNNQTLMDGALKTYKTFCSVQDKLFGKVDTSMIRSLKDFSSEFEYVSVAYVKGALMYDHVRKSIGDQTFFKGLKRYLEENKFKNATPESMVGAFEKVGADTNGVFESFFNGSVIL